MLIYDSSLGKVELTNERLSHILTFHPEINGFKKYFKMAILQPDFIHQSKSDSEVRIFYKKVRGPKYLAVVIKTNSRNFILTAYITKNII